MAKYYQYDNLKTEQDGSFFGLAVCMAMPGFPAIFLIMLAYSAVFVYLPIKFLVIIAWMAAIYALGSLAFMLTRRAKLESIFNLMLAALLAGSMAIYIKWVTFFYWQFFHSGYSIWDFVETIGFLPGPMTIIGELSESAEAKSGAGSLGGTKPLIYWGLMGIWLVEAISFLAGPAIVAYSFVNEDFGDSIGETVYQGGRAYLNRTRY